MVWYLTHLCVLYHGHSFTAWILRLLLIVHYRKNVLFLQNVRPLILYCFERWKTCFNWFPELGVWDFLIQAELQKALDMAHAEIRKMKSPDFRKESSTRKDPPGVTAEVPPAKRAKGESAPAGPTDANTPATPSGSRPPRGGVEPQARVFNVAQQFSTHFNFLFLKLLESSCVAGGPPNTGCQRGTAQKAVWTQTYWKTSLPRVASLNVEEPCQ